jgi:hypothetical protein
LAGKGMATQMASKDNKMNMNKYCNLLDHPLDCGSHHGRKARGGNGLHKVLLGPAMPYLFQRWPPKRWSWPFHTPLDTPRRTPLEIAQHTSTYGAEPLPYFRPNNRPKFVKLGIKVLKYNL